MDYAGKYAIFDNRKMRTYPIATRKSKVCRQDFCKPDELAEREIIEPDDDINAVAGAIVAARRKDEPVIVFSGAHAIKNGLAPIYIDLLHRGVITLFATQVAGTIHDFETALQGATSEDVRGVLGRGEFGMAWETGMILNQTYIEGNKRKLGYGESLGRLYHDESFRGAVLDAVLQAATEPEQYRIPRGGFPFVDYSVMGEAYRCGVPATVHASIGTDIIGQHVNFDPAAKGACSGRDLLIFTQEVSRLTDGGVVLNIGSAVTGPEVLLKAVSMVTNVGRRPGKITCADCDMRPGTDDEQAGDENRYYYYFRDQKSVARRIPGAFGGDGYYIEGDHRRTVTSLYQYIRRAGG